MCKSSILLLLFSLLLIGCQNSPPTPVVERTTAVSPTQTPTPTHTPSPLPSLTPTVTPSSTATPTPTPTPTVTAVPLTVSGDPRAAQLHEPMPDGRFPCGAVDLFDFPIDPPHAARVSRGGGDFGVFRQRYDKYHAGEDWGGIGGATNLGTPVHSIGHGLVTYAEPLGWGRDQGVVIVQHTYTDGSTILSFYGHLDPDSVNLYPGECVTRGQQVGKIGQPRTVPHLHFEMRTQSPYTPLTGYWPDDPTQIGWVWPSQTIWNQRISTSSGVLWTRPFIASSTHFSGQLDSEHFLLLEEQQLLSVDWGNGHSQTLQLEIEEISAALSDLQSEQIYVVDRSGLLSAYQLPESTDLTDTASFELALLWQAETDLRSVPQLKTLRTGGLILISRNEMVAFTNTGSQLWRHALAERPYAWLSASDDLYFSLVGSGQGIWRIQNEAPPQAIAPIGGHLAANGDHIWIYANTGLYRFNPNTKPTELEKLFELPGKQLNWGDITALPTGGVLLAYPDSNASRLISISPAGQIQHQGSYPKSAEGDQQLITLDEKVYLISNQDHQNSADLVVFQIDIPSLQLQRIFSAGTRTPLPTDDWFMPTEDSQLLFNIGGGSLFKLDPHQATAIVAQFSE